MPAASTDKFVKGARRWAGQIGASGVSDASVTTIPLVSSTGLPTDTAVELTIDRVDASGNLTPSKEEVIRGVVSGTNIISAVRGVEGTAQGHTAGAVVEVRLTADQWNRMVDGILAGHGQDGSHTTSGIQGIDYAADAGSTDTYAVTLSPIPSAYFTGMRVFFKANTANTGAATSNVNSLGEKTIKKNKDEDLEDNDILAGQICTVVYDGTNFQLQNPTKFTDDYQIVPTVASNNLSIALKDKYGNDFSASNRLKLKIDTTVNILAAAVSFTKNAGTNLCNLGSAELATKENDLFLYAIQETGGSAGLKFGFSRINHARKMGDFVNTSTSQYYIAGNWTNFNSTDKVRVIGRFAATLGVSASYNWSVPTYDSSNLINEPIYETRELDQVLGLGNVTEGNGTGSMKYKLVGNKVLVNGVFTWGSTTSASGTIQFTLPFTANNSITRQLVGSFYALDTGTRHYSGISSSGGTSATFVEAFIETGGAQQIANTYPITWATGDIWAWSVVYTI